MPVNRPSSWMSGQGMLFYPETIGSLTCPLPWIFLQLVTQNNFSALLMKSCRKFPIGGNLHIGEFLNDSNATFWGFSSSKSDKNSWKGNNNDNSSNNINYNIDNNNTATGKTILATTTSQKHQNNIRNNNNNNTATSTTILATTTTAVAKDQIY